jgi:transcriptional regulator with XRE-family HTH domain/quercetin dioxygenase-like cupin family protein
MEQSSDGSDQLAPVGGEPETSPTAVAPTPNGAAPPGDTDFDVIRRRLVARRKELGLSMSEIARRVGVSASMISQIERGLALPSVATLFSLAAALGATVDAFFAEAATGAGAAAPPGAVATSIVTRPTVPARSAAERPDWPLDTAAGWPETGTEAGLAAAPMREGRHVVRPGQRASIQISGGVRWERLTPTSLEAVDFMELIYEPGAESHPNLYRHPGMEMVLVLEGRFVIDVAFESFDLPAGSSIQFPSTTPHRYVNPTDRVARAVTAILRDVDAGPARSVQGSDVDAV